MATLSIPISQKIEAFIADQVKRGRGANKADVVRRALHLLEEEEALASVLKSEQEIREGKVLRGDLKKLSRTLS